MRIGASNRGSWRAMFLERPHLRYDGVYVSRNTYIRTGVVEWRVKNPVHLVCYFRYLRFLPDGTLLYRTSPEVPSKVERSLQNVAGHRRGDDAAQKGRYLFRVRPVPGICLFLSLGLQLNDQHEAGYV